MADKKAPVVSSETEAAPEAPTQTEASQETTAPTQPKHRFGIWSLFWGAVLVTIGILLLLSNLGAVHLDWTNVWRLWPLVVIVAGFSILASRHWIWRVLAVLVVIVTLGGVIWFTTGNNLPQGQLRTQQVSIQPADSVKQARLELEAGASKLDINSHAGGSIVDATLESSSQTLSKQETRSGDTQIVHLAASTDQDWWNHASGKTTWTVSATEQLPLALFVQAGASQTTADLSNTQLRSLELNAGASTLDVKLGAKESNQAVTIDSGASTITLRLPKDSGISLVINGGLNTKNVADLQSVNENTYRSENYENASKTIDITANAGAATFTIIRY